MQGHHEVNAQQLLILDLLCHCSLKAQMYPAVGSVLRMFSPLRRRANSLQRPDAKQPRITPLVNCAVRAYIDSFVPLLIVTVKTDRKERDGERHAAKFVMKGPEHVCGMSMEWTTMPAGTLLSGHLTLL